MSVAMEQRAQQLAAIANRLFVSYARRDVEKITPLVDGLRQLGKDVWLDESTAGGRAWWEEILDRIEQCDIFVQAVSPETLRSEACTKERGYAKALRKPLLPVQIEAVRTQVLPPDLATVQLVRYSAPTVNDAFALARAIIECPPAPALPSKLPPRPAVPISYLSSLAEQVRAPELSRDNQLALVMNLREAIERPDERDAATELLRDLCRRADLYAATEHAINETLDRPGSARTVAEQYSLGLQQPVNSASDHPSDPGAAESSRLVQSDTGRTDDGSPSGADQVAARVRAIVADATGYPEDMLDLDLDLEADLGIDADRQLKLQRAIFEAFGIARKPTLIPRDYPTLRHIATYVRRSTDVLPPISPPAPPRRAPAPASTAGSTMTSDDVAARVRAIVAAETGYPEDMLDLDLDVEADLGIDTVKQAEMYATIRKTFGIERDDRLKLRDYPTLGHVVAYVEEAGTRPQRSLAVDRNARPNAP